MTLVAGVDGCPAGWFVVLADEQRLQKCLVVNRLQELLSQFPELAVVAVDIPIGISDVMTREGRTADKAARALLGKGCASRVFPAPPRCAFDASDFAEAVCTSRERSPDKMAFSIQAFNILPKIIEVDSLVREHGQNLIREVHPEVCFGALNNDMPVLTRKKTEEGRQERLSLLRRGGFASAKNRLDKFPRKDAAIDDILDAFAACWTARRIAAGTARRIPEGEPPVDSCGLRMEMWI